MSDFANKSAFSNPSSKLKAMGVDFSPGKALVDPQGNVVAHPGTGGILDPERFVVSMNSTLYRFGGGAKSPRQISMGAWWLEKREFNQLVNFAISHDIYVGLALRVLCLVPPEWSDADVLIRAKVRRHLLAWRGLGNSVSTPSGDGKHVVQMLHQNEISERRLHQLYVPGLNESNAIDAMLSIENVFSLDPKHSTLGFLYL